MKRFCDLSFLLLEDLESYYWLGFLMADGHFFIKNGSSGIYVGLSYQDIDHLKKFKEKCKAKNIHVRLNNGKKYAVVCVSHSEVVANIIKKYKISSRKTYEPCDISLLTGDKLKALSIGFIDGDGHFRKNKSNNVSLRFNNHFSWAENLKIMFPEGKIYKYKYQNSFELYDAEKIKDLKYFAINEGLPILFRKWDTVDLNKKPSFRVRVKEDLPLIKEMIEKSYSIEDIATCTKRTKQSVYELLRYYEIGSYSRKDRDKKYKK